jgi:nucleoside-diphosphate-sugar epimerase
MAERETGSLTAVGRDAAAVSAMVATHGNDLNNSRRHLLVTGAAGRLGGLAARRLSSAYLLNLTDQETLPSASPFPFTRRDLSNRRALGGLLRGVDTIIHLAGAPTADFTWEQLFQSNVAATANILLAARLSGCRRVILASSVQVIDGYPRGARITPEMPVWPVNRYAVSKACAEAVAARISRLGGLSIVNLRLGWVLSRWDPRITPWSPYLDRVLTLEDFARAIHAAIEMEGGESFVALPILSNNAHKRMEIESARRRLGDFAQDDSYRLAWRNLPGMARSIAGRIKRRLWSA